MNTIDKQIFKITVPSVISNITVPLLGLVDVSIVGHLGSPTYIGAITVGGMIFNMIYWLMGFLRMGTSGMTSQAFGQGNRSEVVHMLIRALVIGGVIGLLFWLFQIPIFDLAMYLIHPTDEVKELALLYFKICIWGAPAVLSLYGFTGWFIGMQNSAIPMTIAIVQNIVNIFCSLFMVYVLHWGVEGVALGTLMAQYTGLLMAFILGHIYFKGYREHIYLKLLWNKERMKSFFSVNRDIFFRTLCIIAVTLYFTSAGARQGDVILAVNALLMQFFTIYSYIMDGFAYAGEALSGKYIGARNKPMFRKMTKRLFIFGVLSSLLFTLAYMLGGQWFVTLLTNDASVISTSAHYMGWIISIPILGMAAFIWDGIFIGATATKEMLFSMFFSSTAFFLVYFCFSGMGNHALWCSFVVYLFMRGGIQALLYGKVLRKSFPSSCKC